jgi:hypothetical protein
MQPVHDLPKAYEVWKHESFVKNISQQYIIQEIKKGIFLNWVVSSG